MNIGNKVLILIVLILTIVVLVSVCTEQNQPIKMASIEEETLIEGEYLRIGDAYEDHLIFSGITIDDKGDKKAFLEFGAPTHPKKRATVGIGETMTVKTRESGKDQEKTISLKEINEIRTKEEDRFFIVIKIESASIN